MATPARPNAAKNTVKHIENSEKHQFGVLSKTGSIRPHPAIKDDWEWLKNNPPDAPQPLEATHHWCASKITRNTLSGGNHQHTSSGLFQTNVEPLAALKHGRNEVIDKGKHLVGVLKGQDGQDSRKSRKSRYYSEMMHPPHPLLANPCKTPQSRAGNLPASNPTHSDAFLHRSEPDLSTLGATHCNTVYMCLQDLPTSKSTRIDAFLRVPNSILHQTGPPHVLASTLMRSDMFPLDFEPNRAVLTAGPLSYYPDDESSSPSTPAESFRPKTTSASPQGLLASKPMHSNPLQLDFKPDATISTLGPFHSDDKPSSPSAPAMSFRPEMASMHTRSLSAPETMQIALFGGNRHHLAFPNPTRTDPEPMALSQWPNVATTMSKRDWKEKIHSEKHLLGVLKGKERQDMEKLRIAVGNNGKQSLNCFPKSPTFQVPAPPLLVPKSTLIAPLHGTTTSSTLFSTRTTPQRVDDPSLPPLMMNHCKMASQDPPPLLASKSAWNGAGRQVINPVSPPFAMMHRKSTSCSPLYHQASETACIASHGGPPSPLVPQLTRIASAGGSHCRFVPLGPPGTTPEPMALSRWPNVATVMLKCDWKKKFDEAKQLLGVLKGKDRQEEEELWIASPDGNIPPPRFTAAARTAATADCPHDIMHHACGL